MARLFGRRERSSGSSGSARPSHSDLLQENARLRRENARQRERIEKLESFVERLQRQIKRSSAPFSRDNPKRRPARPGRKPGAAYGTKAQRPVPDHIDETIRVGLPERCPGCAGPLRRERTALQFQEELPVVRAHVTRFEVEVGACRRCGRRVQARHPAQTSDALGAAGVTLGPRAVAVAARLNKEWGIPHAKCADILRTLGGIEISPGRLAGVLARAARAAEPTYEAIQEGVAASAVVAPDETVLVSPSLFRWKPALEGSTWRGGRYGRRAGDSR